MEWVELHSDNLTHNKKYALELFEALAPLNMNFYGETAILIAKDKELLEAACKAGVKALLFGIETPSEEALKEQGKDFVKPAQIKEYVKVVKSYGIEVVGDFLFGFDAHDTDIFDQTVDFIKEIGVDTAYPHLMIPFPGSETFKKLDAEGRILTKDWSKYDGTNAVFQPVKMTPKELENGTWSVYKETEKLNNRKTNSDMGSSNDKMDNTNKKIKGNSDVKWKTIIALVLLPVAYMFNLLNFYFAALFLIWSINSIRDRSTFYLDNISRDEKPALYWIVTLLWIVLSVVSLLYSEPVIKMLYAYYYY